jgi:hypothetical protein
MGQVSRYKSPSVGQVNDPVGPEMGQVSGYKTPLEEHTASGVLRTHLNRIKDVADQGPGQIEDAKGKREINKLVAQAEAAAILDAAENRKKAWEAMGPEAEQALNEELVNSKTFREGIIEDVLDRMVELDRSSRTQFSRRNQWPKKYETGSVKWSPKR